jgi:hypothetical protein
MKLLDAQRDACLLLLLRDPHQHFNTSMSWTAVSHLLNHGLFDAQRDVRLLLLLLLDPHQHFLHL